MAGVYLIDANLQIRQSNNIDAQAWRFIKVGGDKYIFKSKIKNFIDASDAVKAGINLFMNCYSGKNA